MKYSLVCSLLLIALSSSYQIAHSAEISFAYTAINVPGSSSTMAYGINNSSQIVGAYTDSAGMHGFLDTNGVFTTLPFVPTGINNVGEIVGYSADGVFLDINGTVTDLALPGFSSLLSLQTARQAKINDAGQIVGNYLDNQFNLQAFVYTQGTFTFLLNNSQQTIIANKINNVGQIVVTRILGFGNPETYLYQNGQYTPIFTGHDQGINLAYGVAINNLGQIVGTNPPNTYIYKDGTIDHFTFPGIPIDSNDAGQIVGGSILATPDPEPTSTLLFVGGLAVLVLRIRGKLS